MKVDFTRWFLNGIF